MSLPSIIQLPTLQFLTYSPDKLFPAHLDTIGENNTPTALKGCEGEKEIVTFTSYDKKDAKYACFNDNNMLNKSTLSSALQMQYLPQKLSVLSKQKY